MPTVSLFWLFLEAGLIATTLLIATVVVLRVFFPKVFRRMARKISKKMRIKYEKQIVEQYDQELATGKKLGKGVLKNKRSQRLKWNQRFLKKLGLRDYSVKKLSERQKQKRRNRMHKAVEYLGKQKVDYKAPYYKSMIEGKPTHNQLPMQAGVKEREFSKKELVKSKKYLESASDNSVIKTLSQKAKDEFVKISTNPLFKSMDNDSTGNKKFNKINIYADNNLEVPAENFVAKNKYMFYKVSSIMLKNIAENANSDVFPIKINQSIINNKGQELMQSKEYTKQDLEILVEDYNKIVNTFETKTVSLKDYEEDMQR